VTAPVAIQPPRRPAGRSRLRRPGWWAALVAAAVVSAGCGDDPPPPAPNKPAGKPAAAKGAAAKQAKKGEPATLQVYAKVEDVVPPGERPTIRHQFRERDFSPDPTGTENRDPFRSFVISQPGVTTAEGAMAVETTEDCPKSKLVATGFSARELRLVGIVSRGTTRFALFSDPSGKGHTIHRSDCVGKEKARVKQIGAGFVTLIISSEPVNGQSPRPPEERSIPLYPKELPIGELEEGESGESPTPPAPRGPVRVPPERGGS